MKEAIIQYNDNPDVDGGHMVINWKPIVRCKDCIYGHQLFADYVSCEISEENESGCHASHKPDWYCADGVKKDE